MENKKATPIDVLFEKPLFNWWKGLDEDKASRAILRRCSTIDEVTLSNTYQRFYRYMLNCGWPVDAASWQNDRLAAIAGLLSHVKVDDLKNLPLRMSELSGDRQLVSELRFSSLLKVEDINDLFISLRRTFPLIKNQTNIKQLALDVYWWNDKTKKEWAYSYKWTMNKQ